MSSDCDLCVGGFDTKQELENHLIIQHENKQRFDIFNWQETYIEIKPETSEGRRGPQMNSGSNDKIDVEVDNKTFYKCYVCGQSFSKYSLAKRHVILHNKEKEKVDISNCKDKEIKPETSKVKKEPQKTPVNINKVDVKEDDNTPRKCYICGESFSTFFAAKDHVSCLLPSKCEECGKRFQCPADLARHSRVHTGQKTYTCEECGKDFQRPSALEQHSLIHTGERPFKCEVCGNSFRKLSNLKAHLLIHTGEKPHKCEECGKSFRAASTLKSHLMIHTDEKNYKCEVCGKSFRQASYLRTHSMIHTGEKPHKCEICGQCFRQSTNLKRHLKTHGGEMSQ